MIGAFGFSGSPARYAHPAPRSQAFDGVFPLVPVTSGRIQPRVISRASSEASSNCSSASIVSRSLATCTLGRALTASFSNFSMISVSVASIEFKPAGVGTKMTVTEQGAYLDGLDNPELRESGTKWLMDQLGEVLKGNKDTVAAPRAHQ